MKKEKFEERSRGDENRKRKKPYNTMIYIAITVLALLFIIDCYQDYRMNRQIYQDIKILRENDLLLYRQSAENLDAVNSFAKVLDEIVNNQVSH